MDYDSGFTDNVGTLRSYACRDQNVSWTMLTFRIILTSAERAGTWVSLKLYG